MRACAAPCTAVPPHRTPLHPSLRCHTHRSCAHLAGGENLSEYVHDGVLQPMQEAEDLIAFGTLGAAKALEVVSKLRHRRAQAGTHEMRPVLTLPSTTVFPGNHLATPGSGSIEVPKRERDTGDTNAAASLSHQVPSPHPHPSPPSATAPHPSTPSPESRPTCEPGASSRTAAPTAGRPKTGTSPPPAARASPTSTTWAASSRASGPRPT